MSEQPGKPQDGQGKAISQETVARFSDELPRQEGHVFFASGDHAQGWRGFIEGAIASGSRTAVTVANSLNSQTAGTPVASVKQPAKA